MMNTHELHQALTRLHEELAQTTEVDDATRQALTTVLGDIQRVITTGPSQERQAAERPEPELTQGLQAAIENFEARHPRLTSALQQVVDRLAEMGI